MNDPCKTLLGDMEKLQELQKRSDERMQAAYALELKRMKKTYGVQCALQTQFFPATLVGTLTMVIRAPDFNALVPSPLKLKLAFNDAHTSVNPLKAVLED